jgi:hypothetical protein
MKSMAVFAVFSGSVFLSGCSDGIFYLGERRGPYLKPTTYSERKVELEGIKPLPIEQSKKMYSECPIPNGVFSNDATGGKHSRRLDHYFRVEGFVMPATSWPGGRESDPPLPATGKPIDILMGIEKGGLKYLYFPKEILPPEKGLILELRPLGFGRFYIGIKSGITGKSGESDKGWLDLSVNNSPAHCENGVLKGFWGSEAKNTMVLGWELFVDAGTEDVLLRFPQIRPQTPEVTYRFKRISK